MTRVFFRQELEGTATFWRIYRKDGVTLGFTSHDCDLDFDGVAHRSAPGMVPSAIRRSASLDADSAEVQGALSHDAISGADLADGRFDGAHVMVGIVDWETLDHVSLYQGEIGAISSDSGGFEAELLSAKANLELDTIPRTSPTCRAQFCAKGCNLSAHRFTHEAAVIYCDAPAGLVQFDGPPAAMMRDGSVRWIDGPHAGIEMHIMHAGEDGFILDRELSTAILPGMRALLREGCDHTLATCETRFGNSVNFQGEPFLPGNDALMRYPTTTS